MAQGTHEKCVLFFLFLLTIYKENVREMNKKQVIRINESQLRQIVTESVKKVLKEETSDSWQHQDFDFRNACERLCGEIELGNYDNRITDAEWVERMENKYENDNNGTVGNIRKAINDRLSTIATDSPVESQYMSNKIAKRIVSESIKKILKEEQENTYGTLIDIMNKLDMIIHSGFIPFSSPSPSSTEKKVADSIIQANELLKQAAIGCKQLGYGV